MTCARNVSDFDCILPGAYVTHLHLPAAARHDHDAASSEKMKMTDGKEAEKVRHENGHQWGMAEVSGKACTSVSLVEERMRLSAMSAEEGDRV